MDLIMLIVGIIVVALGLLVVVGLWLKHCSAFYAVLPDYCDRDDPPPLHRGEPPR